jgi:hypothetical protein
MPHRSAFHLDCTAIFPACQFDCARCLAEIQSIFTALPGVTGLHLEGEGAQTRLLVAHEPTVVTVEQLTEVLRRLPSFYRASFVPTLVG